MAAPINFPTPGCIVEFMEHNSIQIAMVLEESSGKLRLLLPSRRETKLSANRLLPWLGPLLPSSGSREDAVRAMESARDLRARYCREIDPLAVWEISQGEIDQADVSFFAELFENEPDVDTLAAYGHALLGCKTHFRFDAPRFQVFSSEEVSKRLAEKIAREEREALVSDGASFLRHLWELSLKGVTNQTSGQAPMRIDPAAEARIRKILWARMLDPNSQEEQNLWQLINKGLPEDPIVPVQLLIAWGEIPPHYNFWLDRAGYDAGDNWWQGQAEEVDALETAASQDSLSGLPQIDCQFISIDSEKTHDIDDAFAIAERPEGGWILDIALACPALAWPFGGDFDHLVRQRGTSIYLPEADCHMLPEKLGTMAYSLLAGEERPIFRIRLEISAEGEILSCEPSLGRGRLAANLHYVDVEAALAGEAGNENPANPYIAALNMGYEMACARERKRLADGAIIMHRPDPQIILHGSGDDIQVDIRLSGEIEKSQKLVSEMMIAASAALADWAAERNIVMAHRSQDVPVPKEYGGIWSRPEDLTRIMRSLAPSELGLEAAPHAALALKRYAPTTSPLRRYADLLNEAQILAWLQTGKLRWQREELENILTFLSPALDRAGNAQRNRPRYWKLLYFRQQGENRWWEGTITEENENFVTVALPDQGIFVRGRRQFFDERACPGQRVSIRLGRVHPLRNDIHIMEVAPE